MSVQITRRDCAAKFGPATGDLLRLGDTDLTTCGEEATFGGGKVIRGGVGQRQSARAHLMDGLFAGIGMATRTNALPTSAQVPVDEKSMT